MICIPSGISSNKDYLLDLENDSALRWGGIDVLSSPSIIGYMEKSAMNLVVEYLRGEEITVGGGITFKHFKPAKLSEKIFINCRLMDINKRKLTFKIQAENAEGTPFAEAIHFRFIVTKLSLYEKLV